MASTVVITKLDGTTYDLNALGFRVKKFDVPYPNFQVHIPVNEYLP